MTIQPRFIIPLLSTVIINTVASNGIIINICSGRTLAVECRGVITTRSVQ